MSVAEASKTPTVNQDNNLTKTLDHGIKLVTDFGVLPGASQVLNGNYGSGLTHAVVGLAGKAFLGPLGWGLTAANSYVKSTTDKHIWTLVGDSLSCAKAAKASKAEESEIDSVKSVLDEVKEAQSKKPAERSDRESKLVEALGGSAK